jgi:predicted nucleic-acid-binding Zn-ribbon protein
MILVSNKIYKNKNITSILRKNEFYTEKSFTYKNIYDLLWNLRIIIKDTQERIKNYHHNSFYLIIPISIYRLDTITDILLLPNSVQNHFIIILRNFQINDNDKKLGDYTKLEIIPSILLENVINMLPPSTIKNTKNSLYDFKYIYSFIRLNVSEILFTTKFEKNIFDIKIEKIINHLTESSPFSIKFILYYIPYVVKS